MPLTEEAGGSSPVTDDDVYRRRRLPSDLLRLVVAVLAVDVGFLLASVLDNITVGITIEVVDAFDGLPAAMVVTLILAVQLVAWILPLTAVGLLLAWQRYRRLVLVCLSVIAAATLAWGIQSQLTARFSPPELAVDPPTWICSNVEESSAGRVSADDPEAVSDVVLQPGRVIETAFGSHACVPGDGFPSIIYIAGFVAALSTLTPWLDRRWRRAGWIAVAAFLGVRLIDGLLVPVDALLVIALGYAIGAATLLVFGSPDRRPTARDIVQALDRHGFEVTAIHAAAPTGDAGLFSVETVEGSRMRVKVRTTEERAAEVLYRLYRTVRLKGFGDERPFTSLRREVEHEAAMSLTASSAGIRTPRLLRVVEATPSSMLLVFDEIDAQALAQIDPDLLTDDVLVATWTLLGDMRSARIAHRHLSPANVVVTSEGEPWLINFGFAELAARDGDLNGDVAQLAATLALGVGAERSISAAVTVLGREAVAEAAPRLQPTALSSSTLSALKTRKGLLKAIQNEVATQTDLDGIELEKLERVSGRAVFTTVMIASAFYLLIPQLAEVDMDQVIGAEWQWFALVLIFSLATYAGAAIALMGAMPDRLPFLPTAMAQVAASFFNRISPAKVGGIAANIRYLQKSGIDPTVAIAGVGLNNIAGIVVHVLLLVVFVTTAGRSATDVISLPSSSTLLIVLVGVVTAAGGIMLVPSGRRFWLRRVWPVLRESVVGIAAVAADPVKMAMLFGGSFVITMAYVFALWYSIAAFGGGLGFVAVTAVYLAGSAIAQAAPTPGGIGAAEAALIAGLTAFGLEASTAVPAVFLFRLGTFWFPILPGYLAYRRLQARGVF